MVNQVQEKMLNVANHQGSANQNHTKISPYTCQKGYYQKKKKIQQETSVDNHVEKRQGLCTVVRYINRCSHCGKQYGGSSKNQK